MNAAALSAQRPIRAPILALTDTLQTLRQLRMVRSVEPYFIGPFGDPEKTLKRAIDMLRDAGRVKRGDKLVIISDVLADNGERIDSIQLRTV
jgi:pyruvate kinase